MIWNVCSKGLTQKNRVRIRIQPANIQGDRAFEIDKRGAIYAY